MKRQVVFMKKYRNLIQIDGDFYRLLSPFEGNETAWQVVSQDKKESIAMFYQKMNKVNGSWLRLKTEGLKRGRPLSGISGRHAAERLQGIWRRADVCRYSGRQNGTEQKRRRFCFSAVCAEGNFIIRKRRSLSRSTCFQAA